MRFRVGPSSTSLSVLLVLFLRSVSRSACRSVSWSRGYPGPTAAWTADQRHADDSQKAQQLELVEHVLLNDRHWQRVLNQGIKLTNRNWPPYHAEDDPVATDPEVRALLRLVDPGSTEITPLPVLQRAAKLWWLGSYVEYAAYVTRTAFMCFTYSNTALIIHLVLSMWDKAAEAAGDQVLDIADDAVAFGFPEHALRDAIDTVSVFASKMAAVHSELSVMADILFENADADQMDPTMQYGTLMAAHDKFEKLIDERCVRRQPEDVFLNVGFSKSTGSVDDPRVSIELLAETFDRVIEKALQVYDNLNVEAVSLETWASVLDYENPVVKCSNPYLQLYYEYDPFEIQTDTRLREREKQKKRSGSSNSVDGIE